MLILLSLAIVFCLLLITLLINHLKISSLSDVDIYTLGLEALQKNDFKKSAKLFAKALDKNPDFVNAKYNLGLAKFKLKDYENAENLFLEVLKILPKDFNTLFNLALTLQMQKKHDKALELYPKALEINNKDADSFFNTGIIYFEQKDYEKALKFFEQVNELTPNKPEISLAIIRCHDELCAFETEEEIQKILDEYEQLSTLPEPPKKFNSSLAKAYAKAGKIKNAIHYCELALKDNPDDASILRLLGLVQLIYKELNEAKENLLAAIYLDENNAENYYLLSYILEQQENRPEAEKAKAKYNELIKRNVSKQII